LIESPVSHADAEPAKGIEGDERVLDPRAGARERRGRWLFWPAVAVGIVGILVTGALALISATQYNHNEHRLLKLRTDDAGSVLGASVPSIQTILASAASVADVTNGNVQKFTKFMAPYAGPGKQFASVSLWKLSSPMSGPLTVIGVTPELSTSINRAVPFFAQVRTSSKVAVIGLLQSSQPRLGYGFGTPGAGPYVAYGESVLPADRRTQVQSRSSFSDLNFAIYLGSTPRAQNLLVGDATKLPSTGTHSTVSVPFGNTFLTLVVSARGSLAGALPRDLPWIVAIAGLILSLGAAALTSRLIDRRTHAERLAGSLERIAEENRRLYSEQRSIAQTLQHALLPDKLPTVPGMETSARYEAGVEGVDIGGDWYDLIALDDKRLLLVVGDVSGRGLRAAATMASLRYAIHAYAAQNDPPATILTKLSKLVSVGSSGQLATILCALVDVDAHRLTVTSAGHLPPLLLSNGSATYVQSEVGVPIGVSTSATYTSTDVSTPPSATLLAFTDGLVERRGESLDAGLARLREAAAGNHAELDDLLGELLVELRHDGAEDDTAIAGLRWLD
jgi:serine phosphatase RsbU (regulator of sigma subunit)